jgi:hypothetical protein
VLAELASSLGAKEARVDMSIAHDINPNAAKTAPAVNPATGTATVAPNAQPPAAPPA